MKKKEGTRSDVMDTFGFRTGRIGAKKRKLEAAGTADGLSTIYTSHRLDARARSIRTERTSGHCRGASSRPQSKTYLGGVQKRGSETGRTLTTF